MIHDFLEHDILVTIYIFYRQYQYSFLSLDKIKFRFLIKYFLSNHLGSLGVNSKIIYNVIYKIRDEFYHNFLNMI